MVQVLSNLRKGTKARIKDFSQDFETQLLLLQLGIAPGDDIEILNKAIGGSPIAIKHKNRQMFALRANQASKILVEYS